MSCVLAKAIILTVAGSPVFCATPVVFYTDLVSGPNAGGENNNGTIVTICGKNFGPTKGTSSITIGGHDVASYVQWNGSFHACGRPGVESIAVAIGSTAATGPVIVTVGGIPSNSDVIFTVRAWTATQNRIFCVLNAADGGNDSNNGQFPSDTRLLPGRKGCWNTVRKARGTLARGDIAYFGDSTHHYQSESGRDPCGSTGTVRISKTCFDGTSALDGTALQPIALVGYPSSNATIGGATTSYAETAILADGSTPAYWVISDLVTVGGRWTNSTGGWGGIRVSLANGWRIVNNDVQCPFCEPPSTGGLGITINRTGATAHQNFISTYILGNRIHNYKAGRPPDNVGWRHTIGVYLGTDSNEVEFAWNEIDGSAGYSSLGLHIHSSPLSGSSDGYAQWGLHVHDNYIHDTPAGNDIGLVDPSKGSVEFYNNLFVHQADCLAYPDASSGWSDGARRSAAHSIGMPYGDENWSPVGGTMKIFNNTYYDIGNCPLTGAAPGIISWVMPTAYSSTVKAPASFEICATNCSLTQSGKLPATGYTPNYAPFNVGIQVTTGSRPLHSVVDDGIGNLVENGIKIGTIDYNTGVYMFTLPGSPLGTSTVITYYTIMGFTVQFQNNIVYQINSNPEWYISTSSTPLQVAKITGDHNLFYTVGGQTVPTLFTANVDSNVDPGFLDIATRNFRLQATSIARGAGVATFIARDFDGNTRSALDLGAFSYTTGSAASKSCTITGDGQVSVTDVQTAVNQSLGLIPCGSADVNGDGRCDVLDIQIITNAVLGLGCNSGL